MGSTLLLLLMAGTALSQSPLIRRDDVPQFVKDHGEKTSILFACPYVIGFQVAVDNMLASGGNRSYFIHSLYGLISYTRQLTTCSTKNLATL